MIESIFYCRQCSHDALRWHRLRGDIEYERWEHTAGFVILPSCNGTLKSTRIRTRFPLRSRSVMDNLFERDISCEMKVEIKEEMRTRPRNIYAHSLISVLGKSLDSTMVDVIDFVT